MIRPETISWVADYQEQQLVFSVDGVQSVDCPVSEITGESYELVNVFLRSRRLKEASGTSLFGANLAEWPAWAVDAIDTLELEEMRYQNARMEAQDRKS